MSIFLFTIVLIAVGIVVFKTHRIMHKNESSTNPVAEPMVTTPHVNPQITDAVTTKKPRKPRTSKVKDAS